MQGLQRGAHSRLDFANGRSRNLKPGGLDIGWKCKAPWGGSSIPTAPLSFAFFQRLIRNAVIGYAVGRLKACCANLVERGSARHRFARGNAARSRRPLITGKD